MNACSGKRALIIGGGPGGLTAAIALRRAGFDAAVFERARDAADAGSGLTLWPNALKAFDMLGIADKIREVSLLTSGIAMRTWDGAKLFEAAAGSDASESSSGVAVHRAELIAALRQARGGGPDRYEECTGFSQDAEGVTAFFADGSEARGDFLIGADGLKSVIRARLFGEGRLRYAGYTVWRGVARFDLVEQVGLTSMGRGAQFGLFPMSGGRVYWFASANAPEGGRDWEVGRKRELVGRFGNWHVPIRAVIEATDESAILRNDIYDRDPLARWGNGRVSLLGDAAHPSTPNLGQGACQAVEDAVVLGNCLREADGDIEGALRAYERRRIPRANAVTMQSRRLGRLGRWRHPVACWLRDTLIRATPERVRSQQLKWMFSFEA